MKKPTKIPKRVISYQNLPGGLGLALLGTIWLLMDRLGAAPWGYAIFAIFAAFVVGNGIHRIFTSTYIDLFATGWPALGLPEPIVTPGTPPAPAHGDRYPVTLTGHQIHIYRGQGDEIYVRVLDERRKVVYEFTPSRLYEGEALHLVGLRIEIDATLHR